LLIDIYSEMFLSTTLTRIIEISYWIRNSFLKILKFLIFNNLSGSSKIHSIVVFRTGSIGDSVCTIPSILTIRKNYPASQLTLLTAGGKNPSLSLYNLASSAIFDNYIDYSANSRNELIRKLRSLPVDLFIELPQPFASFRTNIRNMIFARLIGAKYGFGWEVYANTLFRKNQNRNNHFKNEAIRLLDILERNGLKRGELVFPLNISTEDEFKAADHLSSLGLQDNNKNIALVIGAKRETNRWPLEYFKEVINHLVSNGFKVILVGGPEDKESAKYLTGPDVFDFTGIFSPMESAVLLKHCLFTISNDTGPLHLSYAVGTPVIGIFSNRDYPEQWFPPKIVLNHAFRADNIPCTICLREICNMEKICMHAIRPADVIAKSNEFINLIIGK
jgi:heptosyltransferase-1